MWDSSYWVKYWQRCLELDWGYRGIDPFKNHSLSMLTKKQIWNNRKYVFSPNVKAISIMQLYYVWVNCAICKIYPPFWIVSVWRHNLNLTRYFSSKILIRDISWAWSLPLSTWSVGHNPFKSACPRSTTSDLPPQVKTQYLHFRSHANYFLLTWKIPEEISRRSLLFNT